MVVSQHVFEISVENGLLQCANRQVGRAGTARALLLRVSVVRKSVVAVAVLPTQCPRAHITCNATQAHLLPLQSLYNRNTDADRDRADLSHTLEMCGCSLCLR